MSKITLRYFKDDCMGCHGCEVACSTVCGTGCIFWGDTRALTERILAGR
jgi:ferredoxin